MCETLVVTRPNCCRWGTYWQIRYGARPTKNSNYMLQWILYSFFFWNQTYSQSRQPSFFVEKVGQCSICTSMQFIVPSFDVIVVLPLEHKGGQVLLLSQVSKIYSTNCLSWLVVAWACNYSKVSSISPSGNLQLPRGLIVQQLKKILVRSLANFLDNKRLLFRKSQVGTI